MTLATIGIIGGMSWYSTREYYTVINQAVQERLGGHHSAPILLSSLDFDVIRRFQVAEDWDAAGAMLADHGRRLEGAGADVLLIATNLMHKAAPAVEAAVDIPLLHIADAVGDAATTQGWQTVGLLGTRWVMEETFYADRLAQHQVSTLTPDEADRELVDRIIFDELTQGIVTEESQASYLRIIDGLAQQGAQAVVMACTEIELLMRGLQPALPLLDSMECHASAAVRFALQNAEERADA